MKQENSNLIAAPAWPLPLRVGFRFVFSYLMLYLFDPKASTLQHAVPAHLGVGWPVLLGLPHARASIAGLHRCANMAKALLP